MGGRSVLLGVGFIQRFQLLFGIACTVIQIDEPRGEVPAPPVPVPVAHEGRKDFRVRAAALRQAPIRRLYLAGHIIHPQVRILINYTTSRRGLQLAAFPLPINFPGNGTIFIKKEGLMTWMG